MPQSHSNKTVLFQCVTGTTRLVNCCTAAGQQPKSSCRQGMFLYVGQIQDTVWGSNYLLTKSEDGSTIYSYAVLFQLQLTWITLLPDLWLINGITRRNAAALIWHVMHEKSLLCFGRSPQVTSQLNNYRCTRKLLTLIYTKEEWNLKPGSWLSSNWSPSRPIKCHITWKHWEH